MPTKNPRLNVVLEPALFGVLKRIAKSDGTSMSLKARDMIRDAIEYYEDRHWTAVAEKREKTFNSKTALSHKDVWNI